MIENFEEQMMSELGIEAYQFDLDYLQWIYVFENDSLKLEFVYCGDGTVSTALYSQNTLLNFCYANGLENLSIAKGIIYGEIVSGQLTRGLTINPFDLKVEWKDK